MTNPTPGDPAYKNQWGTTENEGRTIIDQAVAGITSIDVSGSANIVVTTNPGSTAQDPATHFILTGTLAGNIDVLWPNGKTRKFTVFNNTSGNFTLSIGANNGSGLPAGSTVAVSQGDTVEVVSDGTNVTKTGISQAPASPIPSGTVMLFMQAAAPTGWTQVNTWNDSVIRIVNNTGIGAGTGGSWTISGNFGSTDGHSLTTAELAAHNHTATSVVTDPGHSHAVNAGNTTAAGGGGVGVFSDSGGNPTTTNVTNITVATTIANNGSGTAHSHTLGSISSDGVWRPAYVNSIVCSKG
jgi:hypothetical protein